MPNPGDSIDDYRVVARLRAGGMAQLFLARKEGAAGFARPVAIKVIHPHLARERAFVDMFVAEARVCAAIDHPNVVRVEELRETDGLLYLAMEFIHGVSLAELARRVRRQGRRLSPAVVAHLGARIAAGLHAAHETTGAAGAPAGIVHRDVSPQNVLVGFNGHVKLIDFGVAKALGRASAVTGLSLRGKLAYMAPEQAAAEPIDRRADVFALGVVLWELLTLRRLFDADNDVAILARVRKGAVTTPRAHAPDLPEALDAVVMKALERAREDRFATAADLAAALADAAPESRRVAPEEVGALVCAVASDELEAQRALLSRARQANPESGAPEATRREPDDAETPVKLARGEALTQLTLPVVTPSAAAPIALEAAPEPRHGALVRGAWVAIGMLAVVGAYAAFAGEGEEPRSPVEAASPRVPARAAPAPSASEPPPPATRAPEPPPAPEPSSEPSARRPAPRARPEPVAAKPTKRPAPRPTKRAAASRAPEPATPKCREVDGVELCQ